MMSGALERAGDVGEYGNKQTNNSGLEPCLHHVPFSLSLEATPAELSDLGLFLMSISSFLR